MLTASATPAHAGRRLLAAILVAITILPPLPGRAVTPATPRLDEASRRALTGALARAGIPEVGGSAVLIALLAVLGTAPDARRYRYREPYPQLPDVDAASDAIGEGCARVSLTAYPKAEPKRPVAVSGVYCLLDPRSLAWGGRSLSVEAR